MSLSARRLASLSTLLVALLTFACGNSRRAPRAADGIGISEETSAPPPKPEPSKALVWTRSKELGGFVPATPEELDDLEARSSFVAVTRGRTIWMDLRDGPTQTLLSSASGPLSVTLDRLSPDLLSAVDQLAKRYPVEVICDLRRMEEEDAPPGDLSALEALTHVEGLSIELGDAQAELPDFRRFERLKRLTVTARAVGENLADQLPPSLEELDASAAFSSEALPKFARLPRLRRLWLPNNPVSLDGLAESKSIEELSVTLQLTEADVTELRALPKLRVLQLASDKNAAAFKALGELKALRELSLRVVGYDAVGVDPINRLRKLEALELLRPTRAETLEAVAKLEHLRKLTLHGARLSGADLERLARLPLTELDLIGCSFEADSAPAFARFTQLRSLVLIHAHGDNRVLEGLSALSSLRRLGLPQSVDDSAVPSLLKLKQLRELDLRGTQISEAQLPVLAKLPGLRRLWFSQTPSSDTTAKLVATPQLLFFSGGPSKLNCLGSDWPESC